VKSDEVIALIETDKVTIDVRYTGSQPGVLTSLGIGADDTVTVGQVVGVVDDDPSAVEAAGGAEVRLLGI
jgi:pyruvate/2-oxoglutarate dehydrogenase complex dihydrolipoamide acyltransferase (E2) component